MTTAKPLAKYPMLPYRYGGEIDYASLEFDPDISDRPDDSMEQTLELEEIVNLLRARFTDFNRRPDVYIGRETKVCYNPRNLNFRVEPDAYVAFGVDARAIPPRRLYLPWEVGKPPDWVLEIASESTGRNDVDLKPSIYAQVGVLEFWRFDPSGGNYHGEPLSGWRLANGVYQQIPSTTEPDGILKAYSEVLQLSLAWDEGWPRFYDPAAGTYLDNWRQEREAHEAALRVERDALQAEREARTTAEAQLESARARKLQLEEELRRLREEG